VYVDILKASLPLLLLGGVRFFCGLGLFLFDFVHDADDEIIMGCGEID